MVPLSFAVCFATFLFSASAALSGLKQDIHQIRLKAVNHRDVLRANAHKLVAAGGPTTGLNLNRAHVLLRRDVSNQTCLRTAQTQLKQLKASGVLGSNSDCTKTAAIENVGSLMLETGEFAANMLIILDDYVNGANDCWTINPFKFIPCFVTYAFSAIKNIFTAISTLRDYITEMSELSNEIVEQLSGNCGNSTSSTSLTSASSTRLILAVLENAKACQISV